MDTSPEYIKMCRMAHELQEMWGPKEGDYFTLNHLHGKCDVYCFGDFVMPYCNTVSTINPKLHDMMPLRDFLDHDSVWLPRIDQLITLLNEAQNEELHDAGKRFSECSELDTLGSIFHNCAVGDYCDKETFTVEQLFLVGLYDIEYDKSWNGEDWI